ncbi:MAG: hypothetical protein GY940_19785, partial [bacterium]|nr:hypothetical protein [bacterium]
MARGKGSDKRLVAYVVPEQDSAQQTRQIDTADMRDFIKTRLPDYMVPSAFVVLEALPLTPNGKIDRSALPVPGIEAGNSYTAPSTLVEIKLVRIWSQVLKIDESLIGIDTNFFELGGQSLKATILSARIHKQLNVMVPLGEIFRTPTIKGLAQYILGAAQERYDAIEPAEKREYYSLSSAQKRL